MREAKIFVGENEAGLLKEVIFGKQYSFEYYQDYNLAPVSLTMPVSQKKFEYDSFPPFFDGLLPEGHQLDGLLKYKKIDQNDYFSQLLAVGADLVGNITLKEEG